jgi:hypothetical protein
MVYKEEGFMDSGSKFLTFTSVIMLGLILQVVLAVADQRDDPEKAALEFAQAYFWLDPAMADRLCKDLAGDSENSAAQAYLQRIDLKARSLGYEFSYMKQGLFHIDAKTSLKGADSAVVTLKAERRRAINPVFGLVARWFGMGEAYPVEETLDLVREGGRWKVCGKPFRLVES